jgi:hypothetical protein
VFGARETYLFATGPVIVAAVMLWLSPVRRLVVPTAASD